MPTLPDMGTSPGGVFLGPTPEEGAFPPLTPLPPRPSLGQAAYEILKGAILKGDLAPGSRIVETRMAEALNISRTPVREAIQRLEREGHVTPHRSGGFVVAGTTPSDIMEIFGIRSVLESYAARLAARHHSPEDLIPLEERITAFREALERDAVEDLMGINTAFHDLLYGLSRSPRLIRMIHGLRDPIARFRRVILSRRPMAGASNEDHQAMLDLIRKRDEDGVERLVRMHILRGQQVVLEEAGFMRGQGPAGDPGGKDNG